MKNFRSGFLVRSISLFAIAILICSCTATYLPNSHNIPLFTEKGEGRINTAVYMAQTNILPLPDVGFECQGSYAVSNHLGLMANFIHGGSQENPTMRNTFFESGAGCFYPLGKNGFVAEAYGGIGVGSLKYSSGNVSTNGTGYQRIFIQPSIGYTSPIGDVAVSLRMCGLNYSDPSRLPVLNEFQPTPLKSSIIAEPALTFRIGWKYVKLQTQLCISKNLSNKLEFPSTNFSIGAYFTLHKKSYKVQSNPL